MAPEWRQSVRVARMGPGQSSSSTPFQYRLCPNDGLFSATILGAAAEVVLLPYRISRTVVLDLEREKIVYGLERGSVRGLDTHLSPAFRVLVGVGDGVAPGLHHRHAGRDLVVNEHGNIEIPGGEQSG